MCPRCGSTKVLFQEKYNRWQCGSNHSLRQFTSKTGTIFEDSPLRLDKWLMAMWQVVNCKNGVSSYEIHRAIGVTQKTAWFMDHRIRVALGMATPDKFTGTVEADETFIGAKSRNMHADKRERTIRGRGPIGKEIVFGLLDRATGKVRTAHVGTRRKHDIHKQIRENVAPGAELHTDALKSYDGLDEYTHKVVDHAEAYVQDNVHTNRLENYWSLLKRAIKGTYVSVEPYHLFRYLDEQAYRFNHRHMTDGERFSLAVSGIVGKRLMFDQLTGKTQA
jgi:transposase-like protein